MPEAPHPIPEPFPIPFVSSISPDSGPAGGGTEVRIEGTFPGIVSMVRFGAVEAPGFICEKVNSTIITVKSPPGIPGMVDVTVTTQGGTSHAMPTDRFTYIPPPPVITSLPNGEDRGTWFDPCVIYGTGFTGATQVLFGTVPAYGGFNFFNDTKITATAPPQVPGFFGPVDVRVVTTHGTSAVTPNDKFTYEQEECPVIRSISPNSGPSSGGNLVSISGDGFSNATQVNFGEAKVAIPYGDNANTDTEIYINAPPGGKGPVNVTVTAPGGVSAPATYTYV